jgi:putative Ca2+/H+ antiporter (TMEM165/GDT1 family)
VTTWLEVATVAFVAQLSVLPGEKGQFVIAALATRFHPLVVASGAAAAFAGWTVLEIALGSYLRGLLPELYLELMTGVLFLLFAVMLLQSAPERRPEPSVVEERPATTDGGAAAAPASDHVDSQGMLATEDGDLSVELPVVGREVPNVVGGFLPAFVLMTAGEFGDKTQLVTIGLATQFAAFPTAIWLGEMAAIIPVSIANAYFFHRFAGRFDLRKAHFAGAALFAFFGLDTLQAQVTGVSVWETVVGAIADLIAVFIHAL